ncbi:hypothetical protein O151_gp041 [Staphylococcus phage vB_SauM_Remus]|uniref:Phage PVL protein n=5 Tax=Silviavirus remus TaxID=1857890 RepID=S4T8U1_9CAUD|nr:hypothetical protein QLX36_gp124 [Staphylococcus phage vB_SauM_Romulus]YP_008431268.1 hypothetical protein O151_gp041 [Staphylococcus phage vB_SauM_Remus]QVD57712.1 hypothetical protein PM56_167 [Staphylococcus phage PM56]QVD58605.1 hypothetical protein PM93_178 [Staphylococcus phage PM93]QVD58808.1 hypothetical protein Remus_177 [Silviavirus remus]QVD58999.1 hypothetical protein Romulus_167 [Staphylococcus phage Romulus]AFV81028.1 hypothetical protein Remus_149 [Staphylococcus phage vB_Sa
MKIKTKKVMTLAELMEWAWEYPDLTKGKRIYTENQDNENFVYFSSEDGRKCLVSEFISADDTFEVEAEEEITEEAKVDRLIELFEIQEGDYNSTLYENTSIKECLYGRCVPTKAFYILNDDLTMTLIWKDGELVE